MADHDDFDLDLVDPDDLAELRAIASRIEPIVPGWQDPPADLWARIAAEAGVEEASPATGNGDHATGLGGTSVPGVTSLDAARHRRADGGAAPAARRGPAGMPPWLLVAAAVVAVVAVGAVALGVVRGGDEAPGDVVAASELELLVDQGSGRAELVDRDGSFELRVELSDLEADDGFLEVWMIDTEVSKLVSLGPVRDDGVYPLPAGMDPSAFPIVDVSVEPFDGDPTHSGASVLRGQLEA
jgi:hypothetical protein